jgi:hypothetical protein
MNFVQAPSKSLVSKTCPYIGCSRGEGGGQIVGVDVTYSFRCEVCATRYCPTRRDDPLYPPLSTTDHWILYFCKCEVYARVTDVRTIFSKYFAKYFQCRKMFKTEVVEFSKHIYTEALQYMGNYLCKRDTPDTVQCRPSYKWPHITNLQALNAASLVIIELRIVA